MPTKQKLNLAKVMASLDTICKKCGHAIAPGDLRRIDTYQIECPKCGERFARCDREGSLVDSGPPGQDIR